MEKLIFYCPSTILGGTEVLFSRLAINISNQDLLKKIYILDINNGILTKLCFDYININRISYLHEIDDSDKAIIFVPAKCLHQLYEELENANYIGKISVWQLGNGGLSETLFLPFWLKFKLSTTLYHYLKQILSILFLPSFSKAKRIINNLLQANALMFTDLIGAYETFNDLGIKNIQSNEIKILPIFVNPEQNLYIKYNQFDGNQLNVGWVGRISADFKIHSLVYSIHTITENYNNSFAEITFHIIGNGDALYLIEKLKLEIEEKYANIHLIVYGELSNKDSIDLILKTSDIVIGMGTASLDVGKFGIPSIIISPVTSKKDCGKIKFRWLYDSSGFSLGEFPNNIKISDQISYKQIQVLIDEFVLERKEISEKTYSFIENYFTTEIALKKIMIYLDKCNYTGSNFITDFKTIYQNRNFFKKITNLYKPKWLPR